MAQVNPIELFQFVNPEQAVTPCSFCCIGGNGNGSFSFWRYAEAYYEAAETLYLEIKTSNGKHWVNDTLVYPMCFNYRHFIELSLKYLYIKYVHPNEEDQSKYLKDVSHFLDKSWKLLRHTLEVLTDRVECHISLDYIEQYVLQMQDFDPFSMSMRYPVDKNNVPSVAYSRLDYEHLHHMMEQFYNSIYQLDYEIDNQFIEECDENLLEPFIQNYLENKAAVIEFLEITKAESEKNSKSKDHCEIRFQSISDLHFTPRPELEFFEKCTFNQKILIEELYYSGRDVLEHILNLPKDPHRAAIDLVKMALYHMKSDGLKFSTECQTYFNIVSKSSDSIVRSLTKAVEILEWIDKTS